MIKVRIEFICSAVRNGVSFKKGDSFDAELLHFFVCDNVVYYLVCLTNTGHIITISDSMVLIKKLNNSNGTTSVRCH